MERQRLETLRDYLRNIPPDAPAFDMNNWWKCGTTACAFGHASLIPIFQEAGLGRHPARTQAGIYMDITFKNKINWEAAREFFNLNPASTDHIFDPQTYDQDGILPNEVADRIQELLDESP